MLVDLALRLREVELAQRGVVRAAGGDHHVVDRRREFREELREAVRIGGVEGRATDRAELARGAVEALLRPAGEDDLGSLAACAPGGLEPDAGAAADHDHRLPEQLR